MTKVIAPDSLDEVQEVIRDAAHDGATVAFAGSGSTRSTGKRPADVVISSSGMRGAVVYEPDDMTVVLRPGTTLFELSEILAERSLTAVLPETTPERTIGGVIAAGSSGYSRLRQGPTRDRVLGMTLVTGYGDVVHGGGRVVKNVTGYDLPRMATGSRGTLGFIGEVCLKLLPEPAEKRTVAFSQASDAVTAAYRPLAVLETESDSRVYVEGTEASIASVLAPMSGKASPGHAWPAPLDDPYVLSIRVSPRNLAAAIDAVRQAGAARFVAQHGVGVVDAGFASFSIEGLERLRTAVHGAVVVTQWPVGGFQPEAWGFVPDAAATQRRMIDLFDPSGVLDLGQLPGEK
ncbi:MAG: FAD-binding oxidoreductase [Acidimicrobiia bacterium]